MTQSVVFGEGSERVLLNVFALVSLAGCCLYCVWVAFEGVAFCKMFNRAANQHTERRVYRQIATSLTDVSISNRVWRLFRSYMLILGFFTVFAWYLGASGAKCAWYVPDATSSSNLIPITTLEPEQVNLSEIPLYKCSAGLIAGHLVSFKEWIRLLSASFVLSMMTGADRIYGAARFMPCYLVVNLFLGLLPGILLPVVITL